LAYSLHSKKQYTATSALLFNNAQLGQQVAGLPTTVNNDPQSQQDTNVELLELGDLAQKTATQVGHGLTPQSVAHSIAVTPQGDTTVVNINSTLTSPSLAAQVANAYAETFVTEQNDLNHQYYSTALATVERQLAILPSAEKLGPQGLALENRAQSLATLAQLQSGVAQVAQSASVPTSPSSPRVKRNLVLAAIVGLLIGIVLALAIERFDQRIRDPEELEAIYRLPLLGVVPETGVLKRDSLTSLPQGDAAAAFQFIRAHLRYFNVDRSLQTLLVVSDTPGDGKTTIAHRLAGAMASMGASVLLIEADLRRATLAQRLGLQAGPGLAEVLIGAIPLDETVQTIELPDGPTDPSTGRTMGVVVAGALPPNPAEMLESKAMAAVIDHAKSGYDLVVIDTPPLSVVSDAFPLLQKVDGVIIVSRVGKNRRDSARRLRETLTTAAAPTIGAVANRARARGRTGYDGYSYDYRDAPERAVASPAEDQTASVRLDGLLDDAPREPSIPDK
jgi:capsular exopolysaccharide synthesis family protein